MLGGFAGGSQGRGFKGGPQKNRARHNWRNRKARPATDFRLKQAADPPRVPATGQAGFPGVGAQAGEEGPSS